MIHFFNVTGVTIFLALQIYVTDNMFKMTKTSYLSLQTAGQALTRIILLKRSRTLSDLGFITKHGCYFGQFDMSESEHP